MEYTFTKKTFSKADIESIELTFDNDDYVTLNGNELVDFSLNLYDKLIWNDNGFSPVVESGFLKLKVSNTKKPSYLGEFVHNPKELAKGRKAYIENRCVNEGGIRLVKLYEENNCEDNLFGCITAKMEDEYLIVEFLPQINMGTANGINHTVSINNVTQSVIYSIDLDFENCESFSVYHDEIINIQLNFDKELVWEAGDLHRTVKGGFIVLQLNPTWMYHRKLFFLTEGKVNVQRLEKRLCGKRGINTHDICHLYIRYLERGPNHIECVSIDDIKPDEEIERMENLEEETGSCVYYFEGGYSKKILGEFIVLTFGKNAKRTIRKLTQNIR